ncbi:hypothetical protein E2320_021486, partial [Naja naja]
IEYLTIPRYGLASPFKGHLSTKSNAFCIDSSSRRLSNQYLIRDHMAVHYNKILSAKVSDQQRREKLKKEVEKCEKEMISSQQVSRSSSRESRRLLSATYRKPTPTHSSEPEDKEPLRAPCEQQCGLDSLSIPEKQSTILQRKEKNNKKIAPKMSTLSIESSDSSISSLQKLHSRVSCSSSDTTASKHSSKAQTPDSKACSGDLLDKHSQHFTNGQQPFTPRTLKSDAKSFLSQYRYYTPARRKVRENLRRHMEAETQTEISSFQDASEAAEKENLPSFQKITKESPTMRKIQAEALERLFERHIELNKNHLN